MTHYIIFVFSNHQFSVGITDEGEFYFLDQLQQPHLLIREVYAGGLYYRIPKTSKRFSRKRIISAMKKTHRIVATDPLPF